MEKIFHLDTLDVSPGVGLAEDGDGVLGLLDGLDGVVQDKWELWDLLDAVTLGHGQSWESSGGNGGDGSVTTLGYVDLVFGEYGNVGINLPCGTNGARSCLG